MTEQDGPPSKKRNSENSVFVVLTPKCTSEAVGQYFSNFGKIKRMGIPMNKSKSSHKGFAIVEFESHKVTQAVHSTSDHKVSNEYRYNAVLFIFCQQL